mgnify:FL=1
MIKFLERYQLTAFILLVLALVGKLVMMKFLFIWGVIEAKLKGELNDYLASKAYIIDVEGNVTGKYFWNRFMRKPGGHGFGDPLECRSYAIGRNKRLKKDKRLSKVIDATLLESAETNHCEKAVINLDKKISNRLLNLN